MLKKLDYNYHTHTKRCNHAVDEDEEYILNAINNGIKKLGFSEHIPLVREDGTESRYRLPISKCQDYFDNIKSLREKYLNKIDIIIGFEMEYYEEYFDVMLKTAKENGAEYLILGQHFYSAEHKNGKHSLYKTTETKEELAIYVDVIIKAMKTGVFTYVAHPDIINFTGKNSDYVSEMTRICQTSKELNIPLELNLLGIRENRIYPNNLFWKIAGKIGAPVVVGCDAHSANDVYEVNCIFKAFKIIKKYKLNYIKTPNIIKINK